MSLKRKVLPAGKSSLAVVIPSAIARALGIERGNEMAITLDGRKIVFEKLDCEAPGQSASQSPAVALPASNKEIRID